MDSNQRFRAKGATDLSFPFFYVPETVRVLAQRPTLLGAGGSKSRSRQANGANSRSLENVPRLGRTASWRVREPKVRIHLPPPASHVLAVSGNRLRGGRAPLAVQQP